MICKMDFDMFFGILIFDPKSAFFMGYSLCMMTDFQNGLLSRIFRVFFVEKNVRKNNKYWSNETILKIGHLAKAIAHTKAIAFAKWSVWVKS